MLAISVSPPFVAEGLLCVGPQGECGAASGALVAGEDEGCAIFLDLLAIILQLAVAPSHAAAKKSIGPLPGSGNTATKGFAGDFAAVQNLEL